MSLSSIKLADEIFVDYTISPPCGSRKMLNSINLLALDSRELASSTNVFPAANYLPVKLKLEYTLFMFSVLNLMLREIMIIFWRNFNSRLNEAMISKQIKLISVLTHHTNPKYILFCFKNLCHLDQLDVRSSRALDDHYATRFKR